MTYYFRIIIIDRTVHPLCLSLLLQGNIFLYELKFVNNLVITLVLLLLITNNLILIINFNTTFIIVIALRGPGECYLIV